MSDPVPTRMTAEEFVAWSWQQPEGVRYELVEGQPVAQASERAAHARAKLRIALRLAAAVDAAGLACTVYPDGMAVRVDSTTVYEPDAMLHCGDILPDDDVFVLDPVVVVEVRSRSTGGIDTGVKLIDYFRVGSVCHYLIMQPTRPTLVHHRRTGDGIATTLVTARPLTLDPPGIVVDRWWA